eukprot:jgi/Orpsp1_1/1175229/evm.model.c7180000053094.2
MLPIGIHKCNTKVKLEDIITEYNKDIKENNDEYKNNEYKDITGFGKLATKFSIAEYAICTGYDYWLKNKNWLNNKNVNSIRSPKELSDDDIKTLKEKKLEKTQFPELFKTSIFSSEFLFFRDNHAWYWVKCSKDEFNSYSNGQLLNLMKMK